ncbi:MAG: DNA-directed RNA polymerase subunit beta', partial [Butyricicoccus porcorum]
KTITIVNAETGNSKSYQLASSSGIRVEDGDQVAQGDQLNEGALNPHDILRILDPTAVQDYLIKEVQKVYRQQGVDLNDKHIEVIVRQMMHKIKVEDAGDTDMLPGAMMSLIEFEDENNKIQERIDAGETELKLATYSPVLMGITKAALATDSFLSAASFQETTRVLTDAAIKGKVDPLTGLKENVLIGKLIPAGSGLKEYRDGHYEEIHNLD